MTTKGKANLMQEELLSKFFPNTEKSHTSAHKSHVTYVH